MLYFAYGSNLNVEHMKVQCPAARPLRRFSITNARLVFRRYADCVREPGAVCHGGLWRITPPCEAALDIYEDVAGGLYRKQRVELSAPVDGGTEMLVYVMNSTDIVPPSPSYLELIRQGYRDFELPAAALDDAERTSPSRGGNTVSPSSNLKPWRLKITEASDHRPGTLSDEKLPGSGCSRNLHAWQSSGARGVLQIWI